MIKMDTPFKQEAAHRKIVLDVCKRYGWTIEYVQDMDNEWLDWILRFWEEEAKQSKVNAWQQSK